MHSFVINRTQSQSGRNRSKSFGALLKAAKIFYTRIYDIPMHKLLSHQFPNISVNFLLSIKVFILKYISNVLKLEVSIILH